MCVNLLAPECAVFLCLCVWYQIRVPVKNHIICQTSVNLMPCCIQHTSTQIPPLPLFLLQISPPPSPPNPYSGLYPSTFADLSLSWRIEFLWRMCVRMLALHMVCCKPTFGPGAIPLEDLAISPIPGFK